MRRLPIERIPKLPAPVRVVARNAIWAYGRATASLRPLPDYLVIGAQKAGTTALYAYLRWHPEITGPSWKEVSYFDRHHTRGERWYRGNLPVRRGGPPPLVGEASPSYLFHPSAPARVSALVPSARLVAVLRDPVERAYSHYQHELALGRESLSFEEAVAAEDERMRGELQRMAEDERYFSHAWWNHTYAARGLYAEQLERWLAVFPPERLLVILNEDLADRPAETYANVLSFLGARPHALDGFPRIFDRDYPEMAPETRRNLEQRFAEPNRRLADMLGRNLPWGPTARGAATTGSG